MRSLLLALAAVLALSGCAVLTPLPRTPVPTYAPAAASAPRPARVAVPGRGIDGEVLVAGLGVDAGGGFAEPPVESPELASWYNLGPRPGDQGPAVILGHVNGGGRPGVFASLDDVTPGDRVVVTGEDGSEAVFEVYRLQQIAKTSFPAEEVFATTDVPELRLITCGGDFDRVRSRYLSNIIAWARLV